MEIDFAENDVEVHTKAWSAYPFSVEMIDSFQRAMFHVLNTYELKKQEVLEKNKKLDPTTSTLERVFIY